MPTLFRVDGLRFYFYAHEGDPLEPVHVHVAHDRDNAKFWIEPEIRLARNNGLDARLLRRAERIVVERRDEIARRWRAFHGD
jgi:hypothetical protein